jgi:hypothetical protein
VQAGVPRCLAAERALVRVTERVLDAYVSHDHVFVDTPAEVDRPDLRPPMVALARSRAPRRTARVPDAVADGVGRNIGCERGDREEIRLEQPCGDAVDDVSVDRRAARLNRLDARASEEDIACIVR